MIDLLLSRWMRSSIRMNFVDPMAIKKYSQLRDPARKSLERLLPLKYPISLYIETTNRCNFRCRYCPLSLGDYSKVAGGFNDLSLDRFGEISRQIKKWPRLKVLRFYFMGEPLLNPALPQMIRTASLNKLAERTELTTNASLLDAKRSLALIHSGLDYLRISISSVSDLRHKHITQTSFSVDNIRGNVELFWLMRSALGKKKPFIYVKMLDSFNVFENSRFIKLYKNISDEAVIEKPMNWDGYKKHDFLSSVYKTKQEAVLKRLYPYPKVVCPFPFYNLMINANGDVTVCCVDWNRSTQVGNVFKNSLGEIWNGKRLRDFRRMQFSGNRKANPSCANCQFLFTTPDNLDNIRPENIDSILGLRQKGVKEKA